MKGEKGGNTRGRREKRMIFLLTGF
jgi:hypothetical protein